MNNEFSQTSEQITHNNRRSLWLSFSLLCFTLSSVFPGCATMEETGIGSHSQMPTIDYARKKSDWPSSVSENHQNLSVSRELTAEEDVQEGDRYQRQGKPMLALTYYEKAITKNPDLLEVRLKIGNLLLRNGKALDAQTQFIKILDNHADHAAAHEGLGHAYFQLEQFEKAELHLWRAIDLNPHLWKPHALLGIIYDLKGQHQAAITEHRLAIEQHGEMGELYNNLGVSYSLAGDNRQASIAFREALRKGASQDQIYNNLGLSLTRLGNYHGALDVLYYEGHEAQAYNNLGVLMLKDGHPQQAIACFEQALEAQPTFYPKAKHNLKRARSLLRQQVLDGPPLPEGISSPCNTLAS